MSFLVQMHFLMSTFLPAGYVIEENEEEKSKEREVEKTKVAMKKRELSK